MGRSPRASPASIVWWISHTPVCAIDSATARTKNGENGEPITPYALFAITLYAVLMRNACHHSGEPGAAAACFFDQNLRSARTSSMKSASSPFTSVRNPIRVDGARDRFGGIGPFNGTIGSTVSGDMFQVIAIDGYIPEKSSTWTSLTIPVSWGSST